MDKIKGVITGDIIESSAIQIRYRDFLLESMLRIADELNIIEPLSIEFFRGANLPANERLRNYMIISHLQ